MRTIGLLRGGLLAGTALALLTPAVMAQAPSFDELVPLVQGGSEAIEGEPRVEEGRIITNVVQSGANFAFAQIVEQQDGDGVRDIVVPSGFAVISAATEDYRTYENLNATLLSKRAAYTRAMARALNQLVAHSEGLYNTCKFASSTSIQTLDTGAEEGRANVRTDVEEFCSQTVEGMLKGYVTYAVKDDVAAEKTVTVALASSPRTLAATRRTGATIIESEDMREAWDRIMAEIMAGVVPPVGARLITDPESGETVVVGFGSAIVRQNSNPTVARSLRRAAKEQAQMRANNALLGFLDGSRGVWENRLDEKQIEEALQVEPAVFDAFDEAAQLTSQAARAIAAMANKIEQGHYSEAPVAAADALSSETSPSATGEDMIPVLAETRERFLNRLEYVREETVSAGGRLPPGVKPSSFIDESGDWAVALAVYSPAMTEQVEQAEKNGMKADGARATRDRAASQRPGIPLYGGIDESAPNPAGPSGQVTKDEDL